MPRAAGGGFDALGMLSGGSLTRYLDEVSRIPLLTRDEEQRVSGTLTEAREELLREYARIPEAVEEICRWARRAESGDVSRDRFFDFEDPRAGASSFGAIVDAIERDLALLRRRKVRATGARRHPRPVAGAPDVLRDRIAAAVMDLHPTEPIIAKAEERVRALLHDCRVPRSMMPGHVSGRRRTPPAGSREESLVRIRAARARFEESRRILTESNLRLAIAVAKRYRNRGVPFGDLVQEGNLGLLRACDRFDSRRGYRFSTYAVYWIRQSISRALPEQSRTVRVPPHLTDVLARFLECRARLSGTLGREPTAAEVLGNLGVAAEKVARAQALPLEILSLDGQFGDDGDAAPWDLPDHRSLSPLGEVERSGLERAVRTVTAALTPREAAIIGMRFGLDGHPEMTLEEIGRRFSVTRERVRQIQEEALRKLRGTELSLLGGAAVPARPALASHA